jgi:hypothetical protein
MDESVASTEGDLSDVLGLGPEDFTWKNPTQELKPIKLTKDNVEGVLEGGSNELANDVKDLQAAVEDLSELVVTLSTASQENAFEVLEYLWQSIGEVIKAVDQLNKCVQVWKLIIGDFKMLCKDKGA